jgi:hypothetical protein
MDERANVLRQQIRQTRAALDRDLDDLGARFERGKERLAAGAQWWAGVSAVAAGTIGAVWFWPRRRPMARSADRWS